MATTTIGKLLITLGGDNKGFRKMVNSTEKVLGNLRKGVHQMGVQVQRAGLGMLAGAGATQAALTGMVLGFAGWGDEIAKQAKRMGGVSTEWLSGIAYVAQLTGGEMEALEKSTKRMAKTISDASDGLATYVRAFDKVGLKVEDLINLSPEEAFMTIGEAIGAMENPLLQAAAAQDIFGRAGTQLLPLMQLGAKGIHHYMEEAKRLGIILTKEQAEKAELVTDMITRMKGAWTGIVRVIGATVAPAFIRVSTWISNITAGIGRWLDQHPKFITGLMTIAKWVAVAGASFIVLGGAIKLLSHLISPGGIFTVAVAGIILWSGALDGLVGRWKTTVSAFEIGGRTVGEWAQTVGATWAALVPTFKAIGGGILATFGWLWESIKYGFQKVWADVGVGIGKMFDGMAAQIESSISAWDPIGAKLKQDTANALRTIGGAATDSGGRALAASLTGKDSVAAAADRARDSWAKVPGVVRGSFADIADIGGKALADIKASEGGQFIANFMEQVNQDFDELDAQTRARIAALQGTGGTGGLAGAGKATPAAIERGSAASYSIAAAGTYGERAFTKTEGFTRRTAKASEKMAKAQNDTNSKLDTFNANSAVVVSL